MIDPNFDSIPDALQKRDQWILWSTETRDGDPTKAPKQPGGAYASSTDSDTWVPFPDARDAYASGDFDGIGFVFDEEDPFVGVDLDGCVDGTDLTGGAWDVVKRLDSYTEGSPSGTGLHIICRGFVPDFGNRSSDVSGLKELELYDQARYFTFTGRHLDGTPETVENRAQEVFNLCEEVFGKDTSSQNGTPEPLDVPGQELVAQRREHDSKLDRLMAGDTGGYKSHSEAQQALANKLAFYLQGDEREMMEVFKSSDMCRGDEDVRTFTNYEAPNAVDEVDDCYEPHRQNGHAEKSSNQNDSKGESSPWEEIRTTYASNKGEGRVQAADQLIEELNVATHRGSGRIYVWDDAEKVYADDGEKSVRERLVDVLRSRFSQHEVNEILGMVKPKTYREEFGTDGFVPVANGDLKVTADTVELAEATPEHGFRNRSSAEWDPNADAPIFQAYLRQAVKTEEERKTLQEYAGYSLMYWGLPFHKALFLVGPQASGKSTFLSALQEMLGKTTQLSPQQLVDDEYGAIELEDSWANIASDIPSSLLSNVGRFKEITAGDRIHARRIYEQGYTIRPTAKHFYSANQLPEIKIDDNAFFRRVMIVAFPETVDREDRDPKLGQKLKLEIDGILRWAVEGLQRLLKNEDFTRDLTPQETRRLWDEHASSIGQFKIRCLNVTGDNGHAVPKDEVYDAYGQFCMDKGLPTESQRKLTQVLKRDPRIGQAKRKPAGTDERCRCYTGVEIDAGGEDVPF
ncbi:phage/plasmid primase, P4 family [Salinibacter ruber]|uniref:phage/plasmid primase, P4 family n=1 Tax=Salinibacter ruber TaxID=146919 RepID=UPI002169B598|nr:phage/plasmid primase, P4 family [Salinibacter ruber]MCS3758274.1 P4 family phage/plasmid primase-like protein [Salinibacter ruber]